VTNEPKCLPGCHNGGTFNQLLWVHQHACPNAEAPKVQVCDPVCFEPMPEHLHPADEKLIDDIRQYIRAKSRRLDAGDLLTLKIGRGNNNRLTFHSAEIRDQNPLDDEAA